MANRPRKETHYDRLGVPPTATTVQIKAVFRKRALTAHPDLGGTSEEFRILEEARAVLTDPDRRAAYDATLATKQRPAPAVPRSARNGDSEDSIRQAFARAAQQVEREKAERRRKQAEVVNAQREALRKARQELQQQAAEARRRIVEAQTEARSRVAEARKAMRQNVSAARAARRKRTAEAMARGDLGTVMATAAAEFVINEAVNAVAEALAPEPRRRRRR